VIMLWIKMVDIFLEISKYYYNFMIWYDMIWYDMIWYDMIWYDMIWYDMIWYDMIWYVILLRNLFQIIISKDRNAIWIKNNKNYCC